MAERFPEIQELKQNSENRNTKKSTTTWLNVWTSWAESKNFETNLLSYEGKQLDETLQKFFAEIRKKFKSYVGVIGPTPERKGCCLLNSQGYRVFQQQKSTWMKSKTSSSRFRKKIRVTSAFTTFESRSCIELSRSCKALQALPP